MIGEEIARMAGEIEGKGAPLVVGLGNRMRHPRRFGPPDRG